MSRNKKDYIFVGIQLILFLVYFISCEYLNFTLTLELYYIGAILVLLGIFILIGALIQLQKNLSPFPTPKQDSFLVKNGFYKYVRHPIYTGVLLLCMGIAIHTHSGYRIIISLLLVILFYYKSNYEEFRLTEKFRDYPAYKARTGRFFPKYS